MMKERMETEKRRINLRVWNLKKSTKSEIEERKKVDLKAVRELLGNMVTLDPRRLGKVDLGHQPRMLEPLLVVKRKRMIF